MDPIILTIIVRAVAAFLLIVGGYLQIRYGYQLYKSPVGITPDSSAFEVGKIKLKPKSVGSVVMSTAFLWALCSVWVIPNYEQSSEGQKVFAFRNEGIDLKVPVLSSKIKQSSNQEKALLEAYSKAIAKAQ